MQRLCIVTGAKRGIQGYHPLACDSAERRSERRVFQG